MERTHLAAPRVKYSIALVSGLEYANLDFVRRLVRSLNPKKYSLVLTAVCVPCRVAEEEADRYGIEHLRMKWQCYPGRLVPRCQALVMLYDGGNYAPLSYLASFAKRYAPKTSISVFGPEGPIQNGVDFLVCNGATVTGEGRRYGDYGNPTYRSGRTSGRPFTAL